MRRMNKWALIAGTASVLFGNGFLNCNPGNSTIVIGAIEVFDIILGTIAGGFVAGLGT